MKPHSPLDRLFLLWPLFFIPITLYAVKAFGHLAGTLLLSVVFAYLFIYKAETRLRRLMIVLVVFSQVFETANVASGAYRYAGIIGAPLWISLGWGILGWWLASLEKEFAKISFKTAFAAICVLLIAFPLANGSLSATSLIAAVGLYLLSLCVSQPFSTYAFTAFFGMLAEYSGTATGIWTYYDTLIGAVPIHPDLASLALAYATVLAFSIWVSGYETGSNKTKTRA